MGGGGGLEELGLLTFSSYLQHFNHEFMTLFTKQHAHRESGVRGLSTDEGEPLFVNHSMIVLFFNFYLH